MGVKIVGDNFEFNVDASKVHIGLDNKLSFELKVPQEVLDKVQKIVNKADDVVQVLKEAVRNTDSSEDTK